MITRPIYKYVNPNQPQFQREIGIGLTFDTGSVFTSTYTTKQQVKNQLINYILTNPGERFFDPEFGSGIRALLFEQATDLDVYGDRLREGIEAYVQNIIVNNVAVTQDQENENLIHIYVDYSVNNMEDVLTVTVSNG